MIDFLQTQPEIDARRIGVRGGSQGGALTLLAAAMHPEIAVAAAGAPYLAGVIDAIQLTNSQPYQEINDYLRFYPASKAAVEQTWSYYDCINFAPKIRCPILVNIGLNDDVCPPETGYAVFDAIGSGEKKLYAYPDYGHDANSYAHEAVVDAFFREKLQPGQ